MLSRRHLLPVFVLALTLATPSFALANEICCPQIACAPQPDCTSRADYAVDLDLTVCSKYVWRGLLTVDGFVAQPSIDFSAYGFGLNVWGNLNLEETNGNQFKWTELDLTGSYTYSLNKFDFSVGAIAYVFPTLEDQTTELFASVTWNIPLSPTLSVYRDIDVVDGTYVALSGSYAFDDPFCLGPCRGLSPELSASIGWGSDDHNDVYYGSRKSGFADLTLGLSIPYRISTRATIAGSVHWSSLLSEDNRDANDDPDNLWFGLGISVSL